MPTDAEHAALGNKVFADITSRLGASTYGRVDLVQLPAGKPGVLEVELIDPNLSLVSHPPASLQSAAAVASRLQLSWHIYNLSFGVSRARRGRMPGPVVRGRVIVLFGDTRLAGQISPKKLPIPALLAASRRSRDLMALLMPTTSSGNEPMTFVIGAM